MLCVFSSPRLGVSVSLRFCLAVSLSLCVSVSPCFCLCVSLPNFKPEFRNFSVRISSRQLAGDFQEDVRSAHPRAPVELFSGSWKCAIAGVAWRGSVSACLAWGDLLVKNMFKQVLERLSLLRHRGTPVTAHLQLPAFFLHASRSGFFAG